MQSSFYNYLRQPAFSVAIVALWLTQGGCESKSGLETAKVRGSVTLDGQPLSGSVSVLFEPETAGKMATGLVQHDGSFELTTYVAGDGAVVGKHRVAISPLVPFVADRGREADSSSGPILRIPNQYQSPSTSNLRCEVKAGQTNECRLELKSN
jgi:hypothetical protein